ncbi:hypothetical protein Tco_1224415 [Tanacetum coccineum]
MLCKPKPYYNELNKVAIGYKNPLCLTRIKQVQPALYNGYEIVKNNHISAIMHNTEDTLEIAEITKRKMYDKMKDPECVTHKVKIAPPDYSKENYLATFTPQKQFTPERIFWSQDIIKMKAEALKEQTTASRPTKALTVYLPNTPATLVPSLLLTKSQRKGALNKPRSVYVATNSELNVSSFTKMHDAHTSLKARCLELEVELSNLRDKIQKDNHNELVKRFSNLKNKLSCVNKDHVKPKVLTPGKYAIDVEHIPPHNRNNREVHLVYLKHLKESVETLREIVEEAKVERPLDRSLVSACLYTKHSQKLLEYVIGTCPKDLNTQDNKHASTPLPKKKQTNVPPSTGVNNCTDASRSQPRSNTKKNRILSAKSVNMKKVEEHPRIIKSSLKTMNHVDSSISSKHTVVHMMRDLSRLKNFVKKFIGTVRFGNDHFGAIMGYGDYVIGESVIFRVYYVEGLGHNLFSVRQFCDSDLEVAFRKHSCYIRDTDGVELIKGSHGSNFYTISIEDMMKSSPICLLSKASKNKSWL